MNEIIIKEYTDKYLEDVRDLLVELEEYLVSIDKDNLDQVGEHYREKMALYDLDEVNNNNGKCYLAIKNDEVVGLIMGVETRYEEKDYLDYKCPKKGRIIELIVTKTARADGIGKALMNQMEKYFLKIGCQYISIEVFGYNDLAVRFYEKNDYHTRVIDMIKKI